jgi:ribose transport system permease protein
VSATAAPATPPVRSELRDRRSLLINGSFVLAFVVLVIVAAFTSDAFLTESNFTNLMRQMVTTGLLGLGMLVVVLTAGIDLSVGSIVALTGIMAAGFSASMPIPLAMACAVVVGVACGICQGAVIARFHIAPFVVTLGGLTTIRGLTYVYSETPITPEKAGFLSIGTNNVGPVPIAAIVMLVCFALVWVFLARTASGRALIAIGGNREAVRLAGIGVSRHLLLAYAISGFCAGLAGVILASRVGIAQPSVAVGFELNAIAACVIGGASLAGGRGSVIGTLGGVVLLALIDNLLTLYDVQSYWQQVLKGLIIVFVVLARRQEEE